MQDETKRVAGGSPEIGAAAGIGRRAWLAGMFTACLGGSLSRGDDGPARKDDPADIEEREIETVLAAGVEGRLPPFKISKSEHYLAVGDASTKFRELTLRDCEAVSADFLDYYHGLGFDVRRPEHRLTVVTLADDRAFYSFLFPHEKPLPKQPGPPPAVHGLYNHDNNRLIVYDHRALGPQFGPPRPGYMNLRVTAHEATHQLTFNTGLLDRKRDAPVCIIEGLAMYGEVRKSSGRTPPGENNTYRLNELATQQRARVPWISVTDLLSDDKHIRPPARESGLAYAESWLLIDMILKDPNRVAGFREYLKTVRARKDAVNRVHDARAHLGDLDVLDQKLRAHALKRLKS